MFFIFFLIVWFILNAKITLELLFFGIGISAALYLFTWKVMGYHPKKDLVILKNMGRIIKYLIILLWEIVKANIAVIKIVLNPKAKIKPKMVYFKTDLKSDIGKTALANSITLTPGTITVSIDEDVVCVHALDDSMTDGLDESCFVTQLRKMEENR